MNKERMLLVVVASAFGLAAVVVVLTHSLPEEEAKNFNALSNLSMVSDFRIIKNASQQDDTFIYATNGIAAKAVYIAMNDSGVQQILSDSRGRAITIAGVQPTVFQDSNGKLQYDSSGQVVITSNWQNVEGQPLTVPQPFSVIDGKSIDSHQQVWNVVVDVDQAKVVDVQPDPEQLVTGTIQRDTVDVGTNMFVPNAIQVSPGTEVTWVSDSYLQHNVVGAYKTDSGNEIHVDSGFFGRDSVFKFKFDQAGVFSYECTIHSQNGMKGVILVRNS